MFIAIVGTRYSGKSTLENYLVAQKGFTSIRLVQTLSPNQAAVNRDADSIRSSIDGSRISRLDFSSVEEILDYTTQHWRTDFVTESLTLKEEIEPFIIRPFFMLVSVDAPLLQRFRRCRRPITLEDFVREDDVLVYGDTDEYTTFTLPLCELNDIVKLQILNSFDNIPALHTHLDRLNLLDATRLRPSWDSYFMTLASLAAQRSNCMKRRVGAILVRDHRILATGYNGTSRGLTNCNEGGCPLCNDITSPLQCICLHAEENAILEAGRERIGMSAVLYCNTCPCLKCTIIIIQAGVKEVVYELSYKVDEESAKRFAEAGVKLRKWTRFPQTEAHHGQPEDTRSTDAAIPPAA